MLLMRVIQQKSSKRQKGLSLLREILATRFDEGELRTLCFELSINYDDLPCQGNANKARELITYLDRHSRIPELVEVGKRLRPDIDWLNIFNMTPEAISVFQSVPPKLSQVGSISSNNTSDACMPQDMPVENKLDQIRSAIEATFDVDRCFVRERELEMLTMALPGNCFILIGDYGSGKTTLLHRLRRSLHLNKYVIGYLDLAKESVQYPSAFWRHVLISLANFDPGDVDNRDAVKLLRELNPDDEIKHILCLDNVDILLQNSTFGLYQLQFLRNVFIPMTRTCVVMTSQNASYKEGWRSPESPWFNIFIDMRITEISERRVRQLLNGAGISRPKDVNFCLQVVKRRLPFDLLVVAYYLRMYSPKSDDTYDRIQDEYEKIVAGLDQSTDTCRA